MYTAVGYTLVMSAFLLASNVGDFLAILLVLFVPGYVLMAAIYPKNTEIDWTERMALSFGLSIAIVPLLGFLLNFTPLGIRFGPIVATIALFVSGVGYAAIWRRMRLPPDQRLTLSLDLSLPNWKEYSAVDKSLTIALSASIVAAGGALAYVILAPRLGETFTEFYILGPAGNASAYPTNLTVNETGNVALGVVNHEKTTVNYTVRVDLVGVRIVYNITAKINETVEVNRTTWSAFSRILADGRNWTQPYAFRINETGLWNIQFLLFRDGNFSSAYRRIHLFVRVS